MHPKSPGNNWGGIRIINGLIWIIEIIQWCSIYQLRLNFADYTPSSIFSLKVLFYYSLKRVEPSISNSTLNQLRFPEWNHLERIATQLQVLYCTGTARVRRWTSLTLLKLYFEFQEYVWHVWKSWCCIPHAYHSWHWKPCGERQISRSFHISCDYGRPSGESSGFQGYQTESELWFWGSFVPLRLALQPIFTVINMINHFDQAT